MKKIKNLWINNRILCVLFLIIIICICIILGVFAKYFFGSPKSSSGDRLNGINEVELTNEIKDKYLTAMNNDELINSATIKTNGKSKIIYITLNFKEGVSIVEAESKALASLMAFEQEYLNFYDFHYTLKSDKTANSDGFLIMGAKNVNGSGLVWNNNTEVKPKE